MWQGTLRLGRFSFCPDWRRVLPSHLAQILEMSIHVNLMNCRGWAGVLPMCWSRGQMSVDSGSQPSGQAFGQTDLISTPALPLNGPEALGN